MATRFRAPLPCAEQRTLFPKRWLHRCWPTHPQSSTTSLSFVTLTWSLTSCPCTGSRLTTTKSAANYAWIPRMFAWPRALTLTLLRELRAFRSSSAGLFSTNSAKHSFRNWEDARSVAVPSTSTWKPYVSSARSLKNSPMVFTSNARPRGFTAQSLNFPSPPLARLNKPC